MTDNLRSEVTHGLAFTFGLRLDLSLRRLKIATMNDFYRLTKGYGLLTTLLLEKWLARLFFGKKLYEKHLRYLVRQTQLFDSVYYLEINSDVREQGNKALQHYVSHGDREGRCPMPFFDPNYYRAQVNSRLKRVNSLLHYSYIGRYVRLSPGPFFDVAYYLKENKDVARSGRDPILHYLKYGGTEGRSPCVQFDGSYYLRTYPDVAEARVNPLLHYLHIGRFEGRRTALNQPLGGDSYKKNIEHPKLYNPNNSIVMLPRQAIADAKVDVIVPVYKDYELTLKTIYSALIAQTKINFELIVINDCSPESELVIELEKLSSNKLITLLHNTENKGFVYTVNRGIALHPERDVVLLNADTEVFNHWLDRLYTIAYKKPRTGTVTPFSNNATICSYPCFLNDNPYPLELPYEQLDALAAVCNEGIEVEAPTGVGFCMYIRRDCLNEIGVFDEETFGRGYGEENDFCQRAIAHNWQNIIAANTFVRHWGSASFQGEKAERITLALKFVDDLHPDYRLQLDNFVKQDLLAQARERLDWARLSKQVKQENVLIICHNRGGGSERHVQEDTLQLLQQGLGVFYLRPVQGKPSHVKLVHPRCPQFVNLRHYSLEDIESLAQMLEQLHISRIHTHGLVDFSIKAPEHILDLAKRLQVPFWVDLHDYKVICPRINLTTQNGRYCHEPNENACNLCCETQGNDFAVSNIRQWRQMHHTVLQQVDKILVPSADMQQRVLRYFPDISLSLSPHEECDPDKLTLMPPKLTSKSKLRIVVIGAIGKAKGYDVFHACAADAKKRKLPLEFILLGYSLKDKDLENCGVKITGRYLEHEAQFKLKQLSPHVVWLPSIWPETYSYTLSLALNGGYPTFAFDIGAIAARLRTLEQEHTLMPLQMLESPCKINDRFIKYRNAHIAVSESA
jgi:GT2 family glycosyltransferase/glycosyltransferase involved in cell wall biosynthesis